jgi:hypothetical protein
MGNNSPTPCEDKRRRRRKRRNRNRNRKQCMSVDVIFRYMIAVMDRLCGLVVKSSWLQIRRAGFDSRHYQKKI